MSLVARIKQLACEKNLTIKAIEETAGFGNGTIRRWDNSPPSADKLLKIAYMLNTTCEYLLTGISQASSPISSEDYEWIVLIHRLPKDAQLEFKGELKGYIKRMNQEDEASEKLRKAK